MPYLLLLDFYLEQISHQKMTAIASLQFCLVTLQNLPQAVYSLQQYYHRECNGECDGDRTSSDGHLMEW